MRGNERIADGGDDVGDGSGGHRKGGGTVSIERYESG
jgi:hypothetical protein